MKNLVALAMVFLLSTVVFSQTHREVDKYISKEYVSMYLGGYVKNSVKAGDNVYLSTLVVSEYTNFTDVSRNTALFVSEYSDITIIEAWSLFEDSDGDEYFQIILSIEDTPYAVALQYYKEYNFILFYTINITDESKYRSAR